MQFELKQKKFLGSICSMGWLQRAHIVFIQKMFFPQVSKIGTDTSTTIGFL